MLEKTLESPLDCKEIKLVNPKGNQSWRTDVEAEAPILWLSDVKNWLTVKDPGASRRLKSGGEGDNRAWDGWMASPIQWTQIWESSGHWLWTGNARLDGLQAGMRIARRNINNFRYADDTTLMAENEEYLKRLLMKVTEESEKTDIKLNIQKMKIMAPVPSLHGT